MKEKLEGLASEASVDQIKGQKDVAGNMGSDKII